MGEKRREGEEWMDQIKNVATDSRKKSLVETSIDIFLGFVMFLPVNYFVLPIFAEPIMTQSLLASIQICSIFTAISLVRKFAIRRWFEKTRNNEWDGLKNFLMDSFQSKNSAA